MLILFDLLFLYLALGITTSPFNIRVSLDKVFLIIAGENCSTAATSSSFTLNNPFVSSIWELFSGGTFAGSGKGDEEDHKGIIIPAGDGEVKGRGNFLYGGSRRKL